MVWVFRVFTSPIYGRLSMKGPNRPDETLTDDISVVFSPDTSVYSVL